MFFFFILFADADARPSMDIMYITNYRKKEIIYLRRTTSCSLVARSILARL